jgi:hypothetical protein
VRGRATSAAAAITLTGKEFYLNGGISSTDGIAIINGVSRVGNRQLWIGDTAKLEVNTTNPLIRIQPNGGTIDAIATDGATPLPLAIGNTANTLTLKGSSIILQGGFNLSFVNNAWITSADGANRLYFGTNGRTYFGSQNGYTWRNSSQTDIAVVGLLINFTDCRLSCW